MHSRDFYSEYWNPKRIITGYAFVYFSEGSFRSIMVFLPLYLLDPYMKFGLTAFDVAFIAAMAYIAWNFKFFLGLLVDLSPAIGTWRRRLWVLSGGLVRILGAIWLATTRDVWWGIFPAVTLMLSADALVDIGADSLLLDTAPPDFHGFGFGAGWAARAFGYTAASVITALVIYHFGWNVGFLLYAVYALPVLAVLPIKEPPVAKERKISKEAIALTFTDPAVFIAVAFAFFGAACYGFDPNRGLFSIIISEKLGIRKATSLQEYLSQLPKVASIAASFGIAVIISSVILGKYTDKIGHRKGYYISLIGFITAVVMLAIVPPELIGSIFTSDINSATLIGLELLAFILGFFEGFNFTMWEALLGDVTPPQFPAFMFQYFMTGTHLSALILVTFVPQLVTILGIQTALLLAAAYTMLGLIPAKFLRPLKTSKSDVIR
ncbi:MAG: MFS transporter [Candidatus Njordarchaeum guaymaensis]